MFNFNPRSITYINNVVTGTNSNTTLAGDTGYRWVIVGAQACVSGDTVPAVFRVTTTTGGNTTLLEFIVDVGAPLIMDTPIVGGDAGNLAIVLNQSNTMSTAAHRLNAQVIKIPSS